MNCIELFKRLLEEAQKAARVDEVPVAAAIVYKKDIIAISHNRMRELNNPLAHAEMLVLQEAREKLGHLIQQSDLYVSLEPCHLCAAAISLNRIKSLYFGALDIKTGGVLHNGCVIKHMHHKMAVHGGFLQTEFSNILRNFFTTKREI